MFTQVRCKDCIDIKDGQMGVHAIMEEFIGCYVCPKCKIVRTRRDVMIEDVLEYISEKDKEEVKKMLEKLIDKLNIVVGKESGKILSL